MLVAVEGIDGSGKSTLVRSLARSLRRQGRDVWVSREPTATWLGRAVRRGIRSRIDPVALAALFLADRAEHASVLREKVASGTTVVTDRYVDSTTAYQGAVFAARWPEAFRFLRDLQARLFPVPDRVLWLDLPPREAVRRLASRRVREPFERERFLTKVRANYARLARAEPRRWVRLDATRPVREVLETGMEALRGGGPQRGCATRLPAAHR